MTPSTKDRYLISELAPGVYNIGDRPKDYPHENAMVDAYLVVGSQKALLMDTGVTGGDLRAQVEALTEPTESELNNC